MTPETDKTNSKLKTITDIVRDTAFLKVTKANAELLETIETRHLRMAFKGGQSYTMSFEEWYKETFKTKEKRND